MGAAGYGPGDLFTVRLALGEALANALKHGNGGDSTKQVRVNYGITPERVFAEVEDEGSGFDPAAVPDPRARENLERLGGRGLLLMRLYLSWVSYRGRGNRVLLCKDRSAGGGPRRRGQQGQGKTQDWAGGSQRKRGTATRRG
jgi:serine/threonine-protein kinase RsbW